MDTILFIKAKNRARNKKKMEMLRIRNERGAQTELKKEAGHSSWNKRADSRRRDLGDGRTSEL